MKPPQIRPPLFAHYWEALVPVARANGYALALHGSLSRDGDMVAVPWVADAASVSALVYALADAVGGIVETASDPYDWRRRPQPKPHGRVAVSIRFPRSGAYIDLSIVAPRVDWSRWYMDEETLGELRLAAYIPEELLGQWRFASWMEESERVGPSLGALLGTALEPRALAPESGQEGECDR